MKTSLCISLGAACFIGIFPYSEAASSCKQEANEASNRPPLHRTASEEELLQLQEQRDGLLKEQQHLRKQERLISIERLKKEIQELETTNKLLRSRLEEGDKEESEEKSESLQPSALPEMSQLSSSTPLSSIERLLEGITEREEDILANMSGEEKSLQNHKVIHHFAKIFHTSTAQVRKALQLLEYERRLCPRIETVTAYIQKRLLQPWENDKLYIEPVTLENLKFTSKFYITGYDPKHNYEAHKHTLVVFMLSDQISSQFPQLGSRYINKASELLENHKLASIYVSKNKLYCNFGFTRRGTPYSGLILLEKPIDGHLVQEDLYLQSEVGLKSMRAKSQ